MVLLGACNGGRTSTIAPKLDVGASALDFGTLRPGGSLSKDLAVQSGSAVAINLGPLSIDGAGAAAFSVVQSPTDLGAQASGTISVRFAPQSEGDFSATLVIKSTDPDSPANVALSGRGANPKLSVVAECRSPCTLFSAGAAGIDFGARRPLQPAAGGGWLDEPAWPTVTLFNAGLLPVDIASLAIEGDASFGTVEPIDAKDFPIGPGSGQALHIRFDPDPARTAFSGQLIVHSDDPQLPLATVALLGTLAPAPPLSVCAAIVETQGPDGSLAVPRDAQGNPAFDGTQPPVQPGKNARVTFSAFSDHFATAKDASKCTTSLETGRTGLSFKWTLEQMPAESSARLAGDTTAEPTFVPDAIGHYSVKLSVSDPNGSKGTADVGFDAYPRRDLVAQLTWKQAGVDLDVHLVRPGSDCGGSCVFDPHADINGFSARNSASFDWGNAGPGDDPRLDRDDQGDQGGIETVTLDHPENDPACSGGSCAFGLYVHFFADNRSDSGSKPACSGIPCSEGDACGCDTGTSCVAAHCVPPARPVVAVYIKPAPGKPPQLIPVAPEDFTIAGPCFLWHVADVIWKSDGTGQVSAAGSPGNRELVYYGTMTPGSFACAPNSAPGLPAGYLSGPVPAYQ